MPFLERAGEVLCHGAADMNDLDPLVVAGVLEMHGELLPVRALACLRDDAHSPCIRPSG